MKNLKLLSLIIGLVTALNASASEQGLPGADEGANHNTPNLTENTQQGNTADQETASEEESESDFYEEEGDEKMTAALKAIGAGLLKLGVPERACNIYVENCVGFNKGLKILRLLSRLNPEATADEDISEDGMEDENNEKAEEQH